MLDLNEIEAFYPERERYFKRHLLREYLQYKILQIIFNNKESEKLSFLGGTCLRIVYGSKRFSEDLDFDNFGLGFNEFENLALDVQKGLRQEGYKVETKNVSKGAYRCYIRFPSILFESGVSGHDDEKILIQMDTAPHGFVYSPRLSYLNRFEITAGIKVTPADILLSQKILAIFERKVPKGRDFYDVVFLLAKTLPNFEYLKKKAGIGDGVMLKEKLLDFCKTLNFKELVEDVKAFLINPEDISKVEQFKKFMEQIIF